MEFQTHAIAEPHESAVKQIELIGKELLEPRKVTPQFFKKVISLQQNEPLANLLGIIHEKKVTKFPVYHKAEFIGLISQRAIAFWLAGSMYSREKFLTDATVAEVLNMK